MQAAATYRKLATCPTPVDPRRMRATLVALLVTAGCASRGTPYRFASPMIGGADVPPVRLGSERPVRPGSGRPLVGHADNRQPVDPYTSAPDVQPPATLPAESRPIRVASARAAEEIGHEPSARAVVWSRLPAPNRVPVGAPMPAVREPADLRALVGRRDARTSTAAVVAWSAELQRPLDGATPGELVASATARGALASPHEGAQPGDVLVFDRTDSDAPADLAAIAIGHDARGVIEFIYLAGGVVRRGFAEPQRPSVRRDATGVVLNTFMRAGKRWPPKGTHYLAGELLSHVVRAHS